MFNHGNANIVFGGGGLSMLGPELSNLCADPLDHSIHNPTSFFLSDKLHVKQDHRHMERSGLSLQSIVSLEQCQKKNVPLM